jgi:hypothetical protein
MSSLDKLRELRSQLCQKQSSSNSRVSASDVIFDELVSLHTAMLVDTAVSLEYTEKISELITVLKEVRSKNVEIKDV